MILADAHVDLVEVREDQLVLCRPVDLTPVVGVVVDVALRTKEDGVGRDLAPPIDDAAAGLRTARLRRRSGLSEHPCTAAELHLLARVDPVRVLDLRVVRPDPRPLVRVVEVVTADPPERVASADEKALPEEVIAELRVINMRKNTAMCIVTSSRREIDPGDKAVARSGY